MQRYATSRRERAVEPEQAAPPQARQRWGNQAAQDALRARRAADPAEPDDDVPWANWGRHRSFGYHDAGTEPIAGVDAVDATPTTPAPANTPMVRGPHSAPRPVRTGVAGTCDTEVQPVEVEEAPRPGLATPRQRELLDHLLGTVRDELSVWIDFCVGFAGDVPGAAAEREARGLEHEISLVDHGDSVRAYLRAHLGPAEVYRLRQLISFRTGAYISSLAAYFGIEPTELHHRYRLTVQGGGGSYTTATGATATAGILHMTVEYLDDAGITWTRTGNAPAVSGGAAIGIQLDREGVGVPSGPGAGVDASDTTSPWEPSARFWRPEDFNTFLTASASASGTINAGSGPRPIQHANAAVGGGLSFVRFTSDLGALQFNVSGENPQATAGSQARGPTASIGASATVGGGVMTDVLGDTQVREPLPPVCTDRTNAGEGRRELLRTTVWFATDVDQPVDGSWTCLDDAMSPARAFLHDHPDGRIWVELTGHASPRVISAQDEAARQAYNERLAHRRSENVHDRVLRDLGDATGADRCSFDYRRDTHETLDADCGEVQTHAGGQGSEAAERAGVSRSSDPPQTRRVDVLVYRSAVFRATTEQDCAPAAS